MKEFTYSVDARGFGFHTFYVQFKNDRLLTMAQIEFIVQCRMEDAQGFWKDGPPMLITRLNIRGGE